VKGPLKSDSICQSYVQIKKGPVFDSQCIHDQDDYVTSPSSLSEIKKDRWVKLYLFLTYNLSETKDDTHVQTYGFSSYLRHYLLGTTRVFDPDQSGNPDSNPGSLLVDVRRSCACAVARCMSVRPSVLRRCSVETAKHVINGSVLAPFTGMGKRTGMTELEREGMGMLHVLLETSHLIGYVK